MVKFFRKIRRLLFSEGKTTNYLKYAPGEILVVVVLSPVRAKLSTARINTTSTPIAVRYDI